MIPDRTESQASAQTSTPTNKPLPAAWREAALFGALWGAMEVTVGSFLHATRIPLAGMLMATAAVSFLVASHILIRRPFFPLRTALICMSLRALSPEGLMPGPMFAILFQGALVSLLLPLFRFRLSGALVIGAFAALETQLQGFVVKLIAFGGDLWELYTRLLRRSEALFQLSPGDAWWLVALYLVLVMLVGAAGGWLGSHLGRRAETMRIRK